ncbi:MAG: hypothetical protein AB8E82_20395 [Aureispira sp.]
MASNIDKEKWYALLNADEVPKLHSLSLKLKLSSLKTQVKIENITLDEAVEKLHNYCISNKKMYAKDLASILG